MSDKHFRNFERVAEVLSDGAQPKAGATAVYYQLDNNKKRTGKKFYIKAPKNQNHRADALAGAVASGLLVDFIGESQAVRYYIVKNVKERINYIASEIRPGSKLLSKKVADYRKISKGWKGCSPVTDAAKENVYFTCFLNKPRLIRDMARILVGSIVTLDLDCQIGNIIEYTDAHGERRLTKFDDDWALAGILKDKNRKIDLFVTKTMLGKKATHTDYTSGRPANHFKDFPGILESTEFGEEVDDACKNLRALLTSVDARLNNLMDKHSVHDESTTEYMQLSALLEFATHLGYQDVKDKTVMKLLLEGKTAAQLKQDLSSALKSRFIERVQSLQMVKFLLQVKTLNKDLKIAHDNYSAAKKKKGNKKSLQPVYSGRVIRRLSRTINDFVKMIQQKFPGQKVEDFMPNFEPNADVLLKTLITHAKLCNAQGSKLQWELINSEQIAFLEKLRNKNTVVPGTPLNFDEVVNLYSGEQNTVEMEFVPFDLKEQAEQTPEFVFVPDNGNSNDVNASDKAVVLEKRVETPQQQSHQQQKQQKREQEQQKDQQEQQQQQKGQQEEKMHSEFLELRANNPKKDSLAVKNSLPQPKFFTTMGVDTAKPKQLLHAWSSFKNGADLDPKVVDKMQSLLSLRQLKRAGARAYIRTAPAS